MDLVQKSQRSCGIGRPIAREMLGNSPTTERTAATFIKHNIVKINAARPIITNNDC